MRRHGEDTVHQIFQLAFYRYNKNNGKTQRESLGKTAGKDAIAWDRQRRQKQDLVIMAAWFASSSRSIVVNSIVGEGVLHYKLN